MLLCQDGKCTVVVSITGSDTHLADSSHSTISKFHLMHVPLHNIRSEFSPLWMSLRLGWKKLVEFSGHSSSISVAVCCYRHAVHYLRLKTTFVVRYVSRTRSSIHRWRRTKRSTTGAGRLTSRRIGRSVYTLKKIITTPTAVVSLNFFDLIGYLEC